MRAFIGRYNQAQVLLHKQTLPGSDAIDVIDGVWRVQMARGCLWEPAGV